MRVLLAICGLALLGGCNQDAPTEVAAAREPWKGAESLAPLRAVLEQPAVEVAAAPADDGGERPLMDPHASAPPDPHASPPVEDAPAPSDPGGGEPIAKAEPAAEKPADEAPSGGPFGPPEADRQAPPPRIERGASGAVRRLAPPPGFPVPSAQRENAPADAGGQSGPRRRRTENADRPSDGGRSSERDRRPAEAEGQTETKIVVQVEVVGISKVPDPGTVPYTECLTTLKLRVQKVVEGPFRGDTMYALAPGMEKGKLTMVARAPTGVKVTLTVRPLREMSKQQRMMTADDYETETAPRYVITDYKLGW